MKLGELFLTYLAVLVLSYMMLVTLRNYCLPISTCIFLSSLAALFVLLLASSNLQVEEELERRGYSSLFIFAFFVPLISGIYILISKR